MILHNSHIQVQSKGFSDVIDMTQDVMRIIRESVIVSGIVSVFVPGSTGSVTTIEFEDGVVEDLKSAIERIIPSNMPYKHDRRWGDGNGFSHVRAAIMKPGLSIPVLDGRPTLGTWQQIVFIDFDNRPRKRKIVVQVLGK